MLLPPILSLTLTFYPLSQRNFLWSQCRATKLREGLEPLVVGRGCRSHGHLAWRGGGTWGGLPRTEQRPWAQTRSWEAPSGHQEALLGRCQSQAQVPLVAGVSLGTSRSRWGKALGCPAGESLGQRHPEVPPVSTILRWDKLNSVQVIVHTKLTDHCTVLRKTHQLQSITILLIKNNFFVFSPCSPAEHDCKDLIFAYIPRAPDVSLKYFIARKQWNYCSFPSLVSTSWFPDICNSVSCPLPPPLYSVQDWVSWHLRSNKHLSQTQVVVIQKAITCRT